MRFLSSDKKTTKTLNLKEYIKQGSHTRASNNFVGFTDTYGWYGVTSYWGNDKKYPISSKNGLFGMCFGNDYGSAVQVPKSSGVGTNEIYFKPAIWN